MVDEETKSLVWAKGKKLTNLDPDLYRIDEFGSLMKWDEYENRDSELGWEVDQRYPEKGDLLSNLNPLQWDNVVHKQERVNDALIALVKDYQKTSSRDGARG